MGISAAGKGVERRDRDRPALAAIGLEAEFGLVLDGQPTPVESVFRDPRDFLGAQLHHRLGTSYHLPTGGIVYFDTGVIEVATPLVEIERGCGVRAARSLWESIGAVRDGLGAWERRSGRHAALAGFSAHYNISFDDQAGGSRRHLDALARLLAYILPAPVMLLATNRASTGVGVRPRRTRIEVTADFTPHAPLMVAATTVVTGITRAVMQWPSWSLDTLAERSLPRIAGFRPMPHTSRRGWLARHDCYPRNPFTTGADERVWTVRGRDQGATASVLSLRDVARRVFHVFRYSIARLADPLTFRLIAAVLEGRAGSLLDLPERPAAYEDVGRLCRWERSGSELTRSRYERVLMRALAGTPLVVGSERLVPLGTHGWTRIVFRRASDGRRHTMSLDALLPFLEEWEAAR